MSVLLIHMQSSAQDLLVGPGKHLHPCPGCYEDRPCTFTCTCWPEQDSEDGTPRGSSALCDDCIAAGVTAP